MGERKGQNFYYPPDFDPKKHGNLNRYHGVHALRERAAKIHLGILVIRFEMPFNIWCEGCENHVGMGVRYNAEKKKVGNYFSTPIFEFRMKCHRCDNYYEIRTDPKNFDYELVSGCRRQEKRWEPGEYGQFPLTGKDKREKLATDAMFKLEHGEQDRLTAQAAAPELKQLEDLQSRMRDDFFANQLLRSSFRTVKKTALKQEGVDEALRKKSSLGDMLLVPETPEDRKLASMLTAYKTVKTVDEKQEEVRKSVQERSIFASSSKTQRPTTSARIRKAVARSVVRKRMADSDLSDFDSMGKFPKKEASESFRSTKTLSSGDSEKAGELGEEAAETAVNGDSSALSLLGASYDSDSSGYSS